MTKKKNQNKPSQQPHSSNSQNLLPNQNLIKEIVESKLFHECLSSMIMHCLPTFDKKIQDLSDSIADLEELISKHEESINHLKSLSNELESMPNRTVTFHDNDSTDLLLRIQGINAPISDFCDNFCNIVTTKLHINCSIDQVSVLPTKPTGESSPIESCATREPSAPGTITVRLSNSSLRNDIYRARTLLKGTSIYLSEFLSPSSQYLFYLSRKICKEGKIAAAWSYKGNIFIRTLQDEVLSICCPSDLSIY